MTILTDIKKANGVVPSNLGFDQELLLMINSVRAALVQLGIIEYEEIVIDEQTEWVPLSNETLNGHVKLFFVQKTRMAFDPIPSETIAKAFDNSLKELEGRIAHEVEEVTDAAA